MGFFIYFFMQKLIEQLYKFLQKEYETQFQQISEMWQKPLPERLRAGVAIADLEIQSKSGKMNLDTIAILIAKENNSKFRVGTAVRISQDNPQAGISCEIIEDKGTKIVIRAGFNQVLNPIHGKNWTLDEDIIDTRFILIKALEQFQEGDYSTIKNILMGKTQPIFSESLQEYAKKCLENFSMNSFQAEAFEKCLATENFYIVQGPPGTGKTWLLAQLAHHFAQKGERVLVTAFTHRAINNALRKIAEHTNSQKIVKIGADLQADDLGDVPNFEYFGHSYYDANEKGLIVGATPYAVRGKKLPVFFDTIIFDEAGQMNLPLAIAAMLSGKKYIFVGDHQQMPPIVLAQHNNKQVCESVFERLFGFQAGTMLSTTYRMNEEINAFPSQQFYQNKLVAHSSNAQQKLVYDKKPSRFWEILNPENASIFVDLKHQHCQMRSIDEAQLAVELIAELVESGIDAAEIALIAPYRAQGRLIRSKLLQKMGETILDDIVVDTVERIQGQERDVILISLTCSDTEYAAQNAEFYFKPNRLNVALTRAKCKRIVLGSSYLFDTKSENPEIREWIATFKNFYESCIKIVL